MNRLVSMDQLSTGDMMRLIHRAIEMKGGNYERYRSEKYIANMFFEPSTRTKSSFEMAEAKLGITSIPFDVNRSSVAKGETLYDTCRTMEAIGCDALVIRHEDKAYYDSLSGLKIPIINGGDGSGSHPTQSLLDLMTIHERFGTFENLKVAIAGDITHSRVARSNEAALSKLGAKVVFSAPPDWQDENLGTPYVEFDAIVEEADVIMMLRVQHERHDKEAGFDCAAYNRQYGMNQERHNRMKKDAIIMHPAPVNRGVEIEGALVESPRSVIFDQMRNGVFIRMSVLQEILGSEQQ